MKKIILISIAAAAALFAASCVKEPVSDSVAKVPATLTVGVDNTISKTVLGADLSISWDGTESIGVFDGIANTPNKFDATSAGATTSFSGTVSQGAENFIVFYPYQAEAFVSDAETSTIKVRMPAVQNAVKNSFDPAAGLAARVVTSLSDPVKLYNQFALLKVNVDQDGVTSIVVSATNRKLAGGIALKVSTNGGSNGDSPTSNSVTLKNADDSALEQGIYYIAIRPSSSTSPYKGFEMEVVKNGVTKTRSASNDLIIARSHILSIGKVSTLFDDGGQTPPTPSGRYEAYMAGEDIVVGGFTINKSTHGNATLLTASNASTSISKSVFEGGGVVFMRAEGTGTFNNANNPTISSPLYLIADDENVSLSTANYFNLADGSLYMYGIDLTMTVSKDAFFMINKNSSASMEYFVMDHCGIALTSKYFLSYNSGFSAYGVKHLVLTGNKFAASSTDEKAAFINISSGYTGITVFESLDFNNNFVYSTTETNLPIPIFNYTGTSGNSMTMSVNHNLFYNVVAGGCFKHNTISAASATQNVLWVTNGTDPGANAKLWGMKTKKAIPTVNVTDNIAYGTLATGRKWTIADDTVNTGMEALQVKDTNPIATADVTTGTFTMATGYTSYGPQ